MQKYTEQAYYGSKIMKFIDVEVQNNLTGQTQDKVMDNIVLNAFRIAINGSLSQLNMVDGIVDEYEDETGIDTKVGATYDSGNKLYYLTPGSTDTQYPPAHNGTYVKATTQYESFSPWLSTDPAQRLLGSSYTVQWHANTNANQRLHIDLGSAKVIKKIYYENSHSSGADSNAGVKNFILQGSNDAAAFANLTYATNTNWTDLTTDPTIMQQHVASDVEDPQYVVVTNVTAYRYYALKIVDNYGYSLVGIRHIELQTISEPAEGFTLQSNASVADAQSDAARIVLFQEDVDSVILNTDLKAWASRDGGTTFTQITLVNVGEYESGKNILAASVDISGQPSGTSMKYKITTHNTKDLKIHGTGLLWS